MAENWDLEATLINNMGTVLRKQRKFHATVSLHEKQLEGVVEKHGLHSPYVVLARHNLVEAYECLQRVGDAEALLTQQLAAMEAGPAEVRPFTPPSPPVFQAINYHGINGLAQPWH